MGVISPNQSFSYGNESPGQVLQRLEQLFEMNSQMLAKVLEATRVMVTPAVNDQKNGTTQQLFQNIGDNNSNQKSSPQYLQHQQQHQQLGGTGQGGDRQVERQLIAGADRQGVERVERNTTVNNTSNNGAVVPVTGNNGRPTSAGSNRPTGPVHMDNNTNNAINNNISNMNKTTYNNSNTNNNNGVSTAVSANSTSTNGNTNSTNGNTNSTNNISANLNNSNNSNSINNNNNNNNSNNNTSNYNPALLPPGPSNPQNPVGTGIITPSPTLNEKDKNSGYGKLFHYLSEMKKELGKEILTCIEYDDRYMLNDIDVILII